MKKAINTMVESIKAAIIRDMENLCSMKGNHVFAIVLNSYNTYQEEERDGVDYIFNINNQKDLKCCVEGGMTAKEVCALYQRCQATTIPYFYFGQNYPEPKVVNSWMELRKNLITWLDEMLPYVIAYPSVYHELYGEYVTDYVLGLNDHIELSDLDALAELKRKMQVMD